MVEVRIRRRSSCAQKASVLGPVLTSPTKGFPDLTEELGVSG